MHGGGGPQVGEVICLGEVTCLSMISHFWSRLLDRLGDHMRDYVMDRWVTSPTWGPLPPCKQALGLLHSLKKSQMMGDFTVFSTAALTIPFFANWPVGGENIIM